MGGAGAHAPAVVVDQHGTQRILSHWAAQTGGLRVSEDELLAEGRLVAEEEWQGQLAERGLFSPGALAGKAEG